MAGTDPKKPRKQRTPRSRAGTFTYFKVNKIPWDLYDRINGKAGFLGLGRDAWIREVMERETAEGVPLQQRWKKEHEATRLKPSEAKNQAKGDKKET
jgi:hypothetical protein